MLREERLITKGVDCRCVGDAVGFIHREAKSGKGSTPSC